MTTKRPFNHKEALKAILSAIAFLVVIVLAFLGLAFYPGLSASLVLVCIFTILYVETGRSR